MLPVCSFCGRTPIDVGPLCRTAPRTEPTYTGEKDWLVCKDCTAMAAMAEESFKAIQEDAELWAGHVAACDFCSARRGLLPSGLVFQACVDDRREKEARRVA